MHQTLLKPTAEIVKYIKLRVVFTVKKEMPKFVKKPEPVEVMEYSEAKFETTVTGLPEPNVEWFVSYFPGCFTKTCMCTGVYTRTTYIRLRYVFIKECLTYIPLILVLASAIK